MFILSFFAHSLFVFDIKFNSLALVCSARGWVGTEDGIMGAGLVKIRDNVKFPLKHFN